MIAILKKDEERGPNPLVPRECRAIQSLIITTATTISKTAIVAFNTTCTVVAIPDGINLGGNNNNNNNNNDDDNNENVRSAMRKYANEQTSNLLQKWRDLYSNDGNDDNEVNDNDAQ